MLKDFISFRATPRFLRSFVIFLLTVSAATAATVVVSNETQLIAAINSNNAGAGGGVIVMNAGTYTLSSSVHASADPNVGIDIFKPVTLQAASGATAILNISTAYGMRVQASSVTLDSFTLNAQYFGIQAMDGAGGTLTGLIFRNLTVNQAQNGQAIATNGVLDSIIENCRISQAYNAGIILDQATSGAGSNRNLVVNNTITATAANATYGIAASGSDFNTIAGNTISNTSFYSIFVNGGQHNYIGQNNIDAGIIVSRQPSRQALRNYSVNNSIPMKAQTGLVSLWLNNDSDYNFGFLNDGSNAGEGGLAIFNSSGNYVRGNNFHDHPLGGMGVSRDAASGTTTPTHNSLQQNYVHNIANNGGIVTTIAETSNDYGFNYIASTPNGIQTSGSVNSTFYANVIRNPTNGGLQLLDSTTGATFYLNRFFYAPTMNHNFLDASSSGIFDSGSTTLGGNFWSDFTSANGNPSNGSTPYTNFSASAPFRDNYPFAAENLGKNYQIALRLPSAGSYLAASTNKTIAWSSQGCVVVDLTLTDSNGATVSTIATNSPDYGYYRWQVPVVTAGQYRVRADCKDSANNATGRFNIGPAFQITPPDLILLSPQSNLIQDSGTAMQVSWRKSSAIGPVDVYIRYSDTQPFTLLQGGVTADFFRITAPTASTNRASVRLAYAGYGDSTDGWFTLRGASTGNFTAPASTSNLFVGTPNLVEWVSPQGTDSVTLDLVGSTTRNIFTRLGDFSSYLMLVPDLQGAGNTLRLTFYNSAGTVLQQISSPGQTIQNSSLQPNTIAVSAGNNQSAATNTSFATPLQVLVTNSVGSPLAGIAVQFAAPGSGASGSFGGATTVITNGSGIATAPAFTANNVTGTYTVTATTGALSVSFNLTNTANPASAQTNVGYFFNSNFVLDANGSGAYENPPADKFFFYISQQPGDIAVVGDWNGSGRTKVGIYRNGFWILDYNGNGVYDYDGTAPNDKFYGFGGTTSSGYVPVVGDWNGDGRSKIGFYKSGSWALDYNGNGTFDGAGLDRFYGFGGNANEFPILGDWNHDGRTKVGIFYNGNFVLDYNGDGTYTAADKFFPYISFTAADKPVIGDWNGNGFSKIGIYRNGFWILDFNGNGIYDGTGLGGDKFYGFGGNTGEIPIVGDWNGDGRTKVGFYLNGFWALDFNGNGSFDGTGIGQDRFVPYGGNAGEQPLIGKW